MNLKVTAYLSFGSNLGDRYATWEKTLELLHQAAEIRVMRVAPPIETDPIGPIQDQPRYLNSVIEIQTTLVPLALLDQLLQIERQLGRVRRERWGPRTVDLDILLYGDETIDDIRLQVPHPELKNRPFFLELIAGLAQSSFPAVTGGESIDVAHFTNGSPARDRRG
jgi:2-amino-4-hydroxy-6-hydroxymethyldihydropteridine diphosphokinase